MDDGALQSGARLRAGIGPALLVLLLALGGCANDNPPPVELSARFNPPDARWLTAHNALTPASRKGACLIRVESVRDTRADPSSMGTIAYRLVHEPDSVAWLRSGLESLDRDARIGFADASAPADKVIGLNVEIVKAYMFSMTTEKSTNIVVRVVYSRPGSPDGEGIYRGVDTVMNWDSGDRETQSSFDRAMAQMLATLDDDIAARCSGA